MTGLYTLRQVGSGYVLTEMKSGKDVEGQKYWPYKVHGDKLVGIENFDGKVNMVDQSGNILSRVWFDFITNCGDGLLIVWLDGKCAIMDENGDILGNYWFDGIRKCDDGLAKVWLDYKDDRGRDCQQHLWIDMGGNLMYNDNSVEPVFHGYVGKYDTDGEFRFVMRVCGTSNERAFGKDAIASDGKSSSVVMLGNKFNVLDCNGRLVGDGWYDDALLEDGRAYLLREGEWHVFDHNGIELGVYERHEIDDAYVAECVAAMIRKNGLENGK